MIMKLKVYKTSEADHEDDDEVDHKDDMEINTK